MNLTDYVYQNITEIICLPIDYYNYNIIYNVFNMY